MIMWRVGTATTRTTSCTNWSLTTVCNAWHGKTDDPIVIADNRKDAVLIQAKYFVDIKQSNHDHPSMIVLLNTILYKT